MLITLNDLCNIVFGSEIIPISKYGLTIMFIFSAAAVVRFNLHLHPISFGFVIILSVIIPILIGPTALLMSSVYDDSRNFKSQMNERLVQIMDSSEFNHNSKLLESMGILWCQVLSLSYF